MNFPGKELYLSRRRYENGYDLTHDHRYNLWLSFQCECILRAKQGEGVQEGRGREEESVSSEGVVMCTLRLI